MEERSFLFGTRKIEKLLGVSSRSQRNYSFERVVTKQVSISKIHPFLAIRIQLNIVSLGWMTSFWRRLHTWLTAWWELPLHFWKRHRGSEASSNHADCQIVPFSRRNFASHSLPDATRYFKLTGLDKNMNSHLWIANTQRKKIIRLRHYGSLF